MKLQRRKTREVGGKSYFKWILHPPGEVMEALGWQPGDELEAEAKGSALLIRKRKS